MTTYRIVVLVSAITPQTWPGINKVPAQSMTWVEPTYGVVVDFTTDDLPPGNACYVAQLTDGVYSEVTAPPPGFVFGHHFGGWDPATWPIVP